MRMFVVSECVPPIYYLFCHVLLSGPSYLPPELTDDKQLTPDCKQDSTKAFEYPTDHYAVVVFTGRWRFLKIQFPYLFANLRVNGGIIDRIMYMMIKYDRTTHDNLLNLAKTVNRLLQQEVIVINYMGNAPYNPTGVFVPAYYGIIEDVLRNPKNKYFKVDDDVIYIHPGTFESMIKSNNSTPCTLKFGNIAGANWRCSHIHQSMGLFDNAIINPKGLKFDFDTHAKCGWQSVECAQLSLNTFLSLYMENQLYKYHFNGTLSLPDRMRFSINFFMIDNETINFKALIESLPMHGDDEHWWTSLYVQKTEPHCVVGNSLVVHFSYFTTLEALLANASLINYFEQIADKEHSDMPQEVWKILRSG